jgi:hypothetical protein
MKIREHLTYANVAATLALVGVVGGGGAYAAGVIDSGDIENNSVRSMDLRNRAAVKARDVRRDGLTGSEIRERTLDATALARLRGDEEGVCNPTSSAFIECTSTTLDLRKGGRALVIVTGDYFSEGGAASLDCRISLDGTNVSLNSLPGESAADATDLGATDGFARSVVTDQLDGGRSEFALSCSEPGAGDGRLASSSIAVLGISG